MKKSRFLILAMATLVSLSGCMETPPAAEPSIPDAPTQSEVLTEPPALTVVCAGTSVEALRGGYHWTLVNEDGTGSTTIADSAHPLQCKDIMPVLPLIPSYLSHIEPLTAYLQFAAEPDEVRVRCWGEECWDALDAESEELTVEAIEIDFADGSYGVDFKFELKDGSCIYEVTAEWNRSEPYSDTAFYSFCTVKPDMETHPIKES